MCLASVLKIPDPFITQSQYSPQPSRLCPWFVHGFGALRTWCLFRWSTCAASLCSNNQWGYVIYLWSLEAPSGVGSWRDPMLVSGFFQNFPFGFSSLFFSPFLSPLLLTNQVPMISIKGGTGTVFVLPAGHYFLLAPVFWVIYHCGFISSVALTVGEIYPGDHQF